MAANDHVAAVQACGDAQVSNFGISGSAGRRLIADVKDFDETLPGPWEWDVRRLAAGLEVAARDNGFPRVQRCEARRVGNDRRIRPTPAAASRRCRLLSAFQAPMASGTREPASESSWSVFARG